MSKPLSELELDELDTLFLKSDFLTALIRFEVCQNLDPKEELPTITSNNIRRVTTITGYFNRIARGGTTVSRDTRAALPLHIQTAIVKSV